MPARLLHLHMTQKHHIITYLEDMTAHNTLTILLYTLHKPMRVTVLPSEKLFQASTPYSMPTDSVSSFNSLLLFVEHDEGAGVRPS